MEKRAELIRSHSYDAFFQFDLSQAVFHIAVMSLAYLIALPIGIERSRVGLGMGVRTLSIVSISCCALVLISLSVFDDQNAQAKFIYGILTGIGFIGGGALFKSEDGVYGTASAASVWSSAAVGISTALALVEIALVLSITTTITLFFFAHPKNDSDRVQPDGDDKGGEQFE